MYIIPKTIVHTTQDSKGWWHCHSTINGTDYSAGHTSVDIAKIRMLSKILEIEKLNGCIIETTWNAPVTYAEACKKEADATNLIASTTRLDI